MNDGNKARILIVEDDPLIGLDLSIELEDADFAVVGVAPTVTKALALFNERGCDLAILDVNLGHETSAAIATALAAARVPFIAVTGYSTEQCPPEFATAPLMSKPFQTARLVAEMKRHLAPRG